MEAILLATNQKKQALLHLDPRTKLFILLAGNIAVLLAPSLKYEIFLAAAGLSFGLLCGVYKYSVKMALGYSALIVVQTLGAVYLQGTWKIFIVSFAAFIRKVFPCAMIGGILIATTRVNEFMAALNQLRVPKSIVVPLAVLLRYFPMLKEEWEHIRNAMKMRGISPSVLGIFRHPGRTLEFVYVPMLISASKIADELSAAAVTRGIDNPRHRTCLQQVGFHPADAFCTAGFALLLTAVFF